MAKEPSLVLERFAIGRAFLPHPVVDVISSQHVSLDLFQEQRGPHSVHLPPSPRQRSPRDLEAGGDLASHFHYFRACVTKPSSLDEFFIRPHAAKPKLFENRFPSVSRQFPPWTWEVGVGANGLPFTELFYGPTLQRTAKRPGTRPRPL